MARNGGDVANGGVPRAGAPAAWMPGSCVRDGWRRGQHRSGNNPEA
ncbi:hypothetical protein K6L44_00120 [Gluconacetobacter entanii]|uniref:Uncharacterized protein n=1 Tax=Gluconacetobacter entanii TaxID=108528 RepID=A0ABT3K4X6_9PROT|nr:hypothetical protein [Gluconacetobacter entanii]MBE7618217.1 hypothetical protein [Komagataeibacter sp. FXV2]MBY4638432.1 hypothetical protein [Gluconacetobacter entanii]MCW4579176.1 hypothetical protein [Gluconacetobacter entanii]MCW4582566.1 hypothetical protein [Gluconacetobacter entanii]MCW4585961.1 hypothetical protein [Gluconacetobacter entanii]